ncbi:MAG TPA: SRPBCC family protein [Candidatus Elarobacter sp.]|jgi:uncharacterized protein YndB with AHSA1/START domain|nr:SRPBCC family protein [Candidatus Elarobacter sp.]
MVEDRIEREIVVAAPRERVWEIITQAEHVGTWFGESAQVDLRPGGELVLRWEKYGSFYGSIEKIDEPNYLSYRWVPGIPDVKPTNENSTLVEFTLTPEGADTRVRVVETGFGRLPRNESERAEQFQDNTEGWTTKLHDLQQYAEKLPV